MKYLNWIKNNINTISIFVGFGFIIAGRPEIGTTIIQQGAAQ